MHVDNIDWSYCPASVRALVSLSLDLGSMLSKVDAYLTECYVIWSGPGHDIWNQLQEHRYCKSVVILIAADALCTDREFDWGRDTKSLGLIELEKICDNNPEKTFVVFSQQIDLARQIQSPNLHVYSQPSVLVGLTRSKILEHGYYKQPKLYDWVMFNNNVWWHRAFALSYLLSADLDESAFVTVSDSFLQRCQQFKHLHHFLPYRFDDDILNRIDPGYQRLISNDFNRQIVNYFGSSADPEASLLQVVATNSQILFPIRQQTRLEIITGTLFGEPTVFLTEKEMQAIYGCNFMIQINCAGTVEYLRQLGLDVFDDVVNHEYDLILDPGKRVVRALEDNLHLLNGSCDLDQMWVARRDRFRNNCKKMDEICQSLPSKILQEWNDFLEGVSNQCGFLYDQNPVYARH